MAVIDRFMELLDAAPIDGHDRLTVKQVLAADDAIFLELARRCRSGIRCATSGKMPLADNFLPVFETQAVQLRRVPHRRGGGQPARQGDADEPRGQKRKPAAQKQQPAPPGKAKQRGGARANRPGAKREGGAALPPSMVATCTPKTADGVPICSGTT